MRCKKCSNSISEAVAVETMNLKSFDRVMRIIAPCDAGKLILGVKPSAK